MLGCASSTPPEPPRIPAPLPESVLVSDVRVELSPALDEDERARLQAADVSSMIRLGALDWFEHVGRFDRHASLVLLVEVREVHLRGALSTWLWPDGVEPDHVLVYVRFRDDAGFWRHEDFEWKETTRVGGWDWRDGEARLERVSRRLGRRIAELLLLDEMLSAPPPP